MQENEIGLFWTREETRPIIRRKTDTGDGTTSHREEDEEDQSRNGYPYCANRDMRAIVAPHSAK